MLKRVIIRDVFYGIIFDKLLDLETGEARVEFPMRPMVCLESIEVLNIKTEEKVEAKKSRPKDNNDTGGKSHGKVRRGKARHVQTVD